MRSILTAFLAVFSASMVFAQSPVGSIRGYCKDSSNSVVPNVTVELRSAATNTSQRAVADGTGYFQFLRLVPGVYEISAETPGFRKTTIRDVNVLVDQIISIDVKLEIGQVTEVVEVAASTATIEPEKISTGIAMDQNMVQNLPMANRRFNDLAILTPGVTFAANGTQAGGFAAAGSRAQSTNWTIDGTNALDPQVNGPLTSFRIAEAVQEFSVTTTAASAEFGRQNGAQVNVVTKSGTNTLHGSAFWFLRNDALQAADFFTNKLGGTKPILRRNQYGLTAGGPVVIPHVYDGRNKTFFFYSWEALKFKNPNPITAVVPTAAERALVRDPVNRAVVNLYPLPTNTAAAAGSLNFVGNGANAQDDNTHLVRIDHLFSDKDRLMGRYVTFAGTAANIGLLPGYGNTNRPGSKSFTATESHIWNPNFFTEVRVGFSQNKTDFRVEDFGINAASILQGVPGIVDATTDMLDSGLPRVQITGYTSIGAATNLPQGRITNTYEVFLNNTKIAPFGWSRHTLKFGYNGRRDETNRFLNGNSRGQAIFESFDKFAGTCADCGGRALLTQSTIRSGDTRSHWYRYPHSLYIQDDIKAKPNLTLNFGLRWEYFDSIVEKRGRATNFVPGVGPMIAGTNQILDLDPTKLGRSAFQFKTASFILPQGGLNKDWNNFGPVAGFAYTPKMGPGLFGDGKTVIRGGFRVGFDDVFNNIPANMVLNAPWTLTTTQIAGSTQPSVGYGWNLAFNQNVPLIARTTQAPGSPATGLLAFNAIDPNGRTAYAYNWNFGIQRQITSTSMIDVSYIGSAGHKLGIYIDANEPNVIVRNTGFRGNQAPNEQLFPYPLFGGVSFATFQGNSIFHGLVASTRIRTRHGLTMTGSYTWSHAIDNGSSFFGSDDDIGVGSGKFLNLERGNSGNDQRHRFINLFVWELPIHPKNGLLRQTIGGWSLSGITNLATGHPFTVYANTNQDFSGFNQRLDRPDIVGSGQLQINRGNPDNFFDPAYFGKITPSAPCPGYTAASNNPQSRGCAPVGRYGTEARNAFFGPGIINFDATVSKRWSLGTERAKLEFRGEFFNLFNHTNFALISSNRLMSSGAFGQLGSTSELNGGNTGGPRVIQLTLRLQF